jgi:MOSC domain-containing protein YiiM
LFSLELIRALQSEGHPIDVGTVGENLTVSGLDWTRVTPGCELRIGPVRLRVTEYATPCRTAGRSFLDGQFMRIAQQVHPGWSRVCARVLTAGVVEAGQPVELVPASSVHAV